MAQNITLLGASYSDVPAVDLPKTGGGTARFTDVTDTTATASDVAVGTYFYTAAGVRTEGTSTGGGGVGAIYQDAQGYIVVDDGAPFSQTKYITANGTYNVAGYGTADVSIPSGSATAPATISGTSASVSTGTNTLTLSKTVSVTPTVSPGYVSSGTAGNSNVSLTASVTTKAAATITPGTSDQTISSGTYLTGTQTISGDANLVAGNIKSGTTIFGVAGTYGGGGNWSVDTKTVTASNYPVSISFTSMKGEPHAFFLRSTSQISSSGSTTYYYIIDMRYNGTNTTGNCFRIGSTRRVDNITSGYSWSYSGTTLTIKSSAASRSASPGAFNNTYELVYFY